MNLTEITFVFKALSDETRLKIIKMLAEEELCACHILEEFEITQPTLSYHMKMLVDSGIVESKKEGNLTRYSLNKSIVKELDIFFINIDKKETVARSTENCQFK